MNVNCPYNGGLTAEQSLFYEIRIVSKMYLEGVSVDDAIEAVKADNLFQYPTERLVSRMTRACYREKSSRLQGCHRYRLYQAL